MKNNYQFFKYDFNVYNRFVIPYSLAFILLVFVFPVYGQYHKEQVIDVSSKSIMQTVVKQISVPKIKDLFGQVGKVYQIDAPDQRVKMRLPIDKKTSIFDRDSVFITKFNSQTKQFVPIKSYVNVRNAYVEAEYSGPGLYTLYAHKIGGIDFSNSQLCTKDVDKICPLILCPNYPDIFNVKGSSWHEWSGGMPNPDSFGINGAGGSICESCTGSIGELDPTICQIPGIREEKPQTTQECIDSFDVDFGQLEVCENICAHRPFINPFKADLHKKDSIIGTISLISPSPPLQSYCESCREMRNRINFDKCPTVGAGKDSNCEIDARATIADPMCKVTGSVPGYDIHIVEPGTDTDDDYDALKRAAKRASHRDESGRPLHIVFRNTTYHIKRSITKDDQAKVIFKNGQTCNNNEGKGVDCNNTCYNQSGQDCNNETIDVVFDQADNVKIHGCGATIDVEATDFRDEVTFVNVQHSCKVNDYDCHCLPNYQKPITSLIFDLNERTVQPFVVKNSSNFSIRDLTLDGNANEFGRIISGCVDNEPIQELVDMCAASLCAELDSEDKKQECRSVCKDNMCLARFRANASNGIVTYGVQDFNLTNMAVHHFASDGLSIGNGLKLIEKEREDRDLEDINVEDVRASDESVSLYKVSSCSNGRQGLTIGNVNDLRIDRSFFAHTGNTREEPYATTPHTGYPGHGPHSGIDIEHQLPVYGEINNKKYTAVVSPETDAFDIRNTTFEANLGIQFVNGDSQGWFGSMKLKNVLFDVKDNVGLNPIFAASARKLCMDDIVFNVSPAANRSESKEPALNFSDCRPISGATAVSSSYCVSYSSNDNADLKDNWFLTSKIAYRGAENVRCMGQRCSNVEDEFECR